MAALGLETLGVSIGRRLSGFPRGGGKVGNLASWGPAGAPLPGAGFQFSRFPEPRPQLASTTERSGAAGSRCRYLLGCQRPALSRLRTCCTYVVGSGAHPIRWRVELQNRHAATMLVRASGPPSHRATRCSAVHLKRHASRSLRPCLEAKRSG